jgi:hypothetical protein
MAVMLETMTTVVGNDCAEQGFGIPHEFGVYENRVSGFVPMEYTKNQTERTEPLKVSVKEFQTTTTTTTTTTITITTISLDPTDSDCVLP